MNKSTLRAGLGSVLGVAVVVSVSAFANPAIANAKQCALDQSASSAVIRIYKEGALSALGDNHLISTNSLDGEFNISARQPASSNIRIAVPTQSLIVNDPALRANAEKGFNSKVSKLNRAITRKSMLGKKVLHAEEYPEIVIASLALPDSLTGNAVMAVTLKDQTRRENISISSVYDGEQVTVSGRFFLKQSRYGIKPFSIMFGGIRVKDTLRLDFRVTADCSGLASEHLG